MLSLADQSATPSHVLMCTQDPLNHETRTQSELGNASHVWPTVNGDSRLSDLQSRSSNTSGVGIGLRSRPGSTTARRPSDDVGNSSGFDMLPHLGHSHHRSKSQTDPHESRSLLAPAGTGEDVEMAKIARDGIR